MQREVLVTLLKAGRRDLARAYVQAATDELSYRRYDDILKLAAGESKSKAVKAFLLDGYSIKFWMKRIRKLMDMAAKHPKFEAASDELVNKEIATVIALEAMEAVLRDAKRGRKR